MEYEFVEFDKVCEVLASFGLNPCCSGIWIRSESITEQELQFDDVLILVVVEYEFVGYPYAYSSFYSRCVLILVVVEYEFVVGNKEDKEK